MILKHPAITTADQTCIACPEVWEGVLIDGSRFRLRYRSGRAVLTVSRDDGVRSGDEQVGDWLAGIFDSDEERDAVFARLYDRVVPEPQLATACQGCGATVVFPASQDPRSVWCIGCRA